MLYQLEAVYAPVEVEVLRIHFGDEQFSVSYMGEPRANPPGDETI